MASDNGHQKRFENFIEHYARFGYGAKGVIYGSIGLLALMEAFDFRQGKTVGSKGLLQTIAAQPLGRGMLILLTVSLIGYVVWRFIQAMLDPEHKGCQLGDIIRRISYACSGIAYAGVAYSAWEILTASPTDEGKTIEQRAFELMSWPFGRWILVAGGLLVFGIGCYYFYRAIKAEFRKRLKLHHMSDVEKNWATIAGRTGIAARGFVYAVIGVYTVRAAWAFDPSMMKTTEDALAVFDNNPADEWILAILGVGFIAYGIHMAFQARYRRIDPL